MNGVLVSLIVVAIAPTPYTTKAADEPKLTFKDLQQFNPISQSVTRATSFVLYEGLPHPYWEAEELKVEMATKNTIQIHGYPFYQRPLEVRQEDVKEFRQLSKASESYWHNSGEEKLCGGYHPDYCLMWKDGKKTYHFLICFGCHEMKIYGPKHKLHADIRTETIKLFKSRLGKYQQQRPKSK